ncbi:MAG: aminopeptidase [Actinomycetia bacterium]|nr:aminopeptidase [Actinomycetes bacterium]
MKDRRINKLAKNLVEYSCQVKKGQRVMVECVGNSALPLVRALIARIYESGAEPHVNLLNNSIKRELLKKTSKNQLDFMAECDLVKMKGMDAFIGIRASDNANELGDLKSENLNAYMKYYSDPVNQERINNTSWVILKYPNNSLAQLSGTSAETFEDFYFKVCNLDYSKMSKAMDRLVDIMSKTDRVDIKGPGTDISFSIKNIPTIKCAGKNNIPDGEVFTAPVKDSVNGVITYNTPAVYQGYTYERICFKFKKGKIIEATSSDSKRLNQVLDTDKGARYIGEFALGVNPYILKPMKDTLFDEKIRGSFHFTPGKCYKDAFNGNDSAIHWDLVSIQTRDMGGGEIHFDGKLIRKDGRFMPKELEGLNPENLT